MLENKPRLDKIYYCLIEKKGVLKSNHDDITESLLESHDTLIKYNYYHRNYYYQMLFSKLWT